MRSTAAAIATAAFACASGKPAPKPPAAPTDVSATAGDAQVTVLWTASDGAIGYRVYSGEGTLGTHADVGAVTSWTVVGLTNGHTYSFAVSALGVGGESALSAAVSATPKANPPLAVTSVAPADGSTAVPRNAAVVVKFNKPVRPPTAGCSGTVQLSDDSFATCAAGTLAATDANATWTFTPTAPLHGGAKYAVRVTTAQKDANGVALAAQFQSAGFTTAASLTVSVAPLGTVGVRPAVVLTFNRSVDQSTVTSIETGTACGGTVQLSAAGSCVAMTHAWSGNTATFTPAADLMASTTYAIAVTTGVKDSDGVPLDAAAGGGFTTIAGVTVTGTDFQHVSLAWTSSNGAHVYLRPAGSGAWPSTPTASPAGGSGTLTLAPGKSWDIRVAPLDSSSTEQTPTDLLAVATDFTGVPAEWLAGQLTSGAMGGHFRFTSSDTEFFAAYSSSDDTATLNPANADALWIAFDTTDSAGEWVTQTGGGSQIIWPFKADYVVELKDAQTMNLRNAAAATWSPLASATAKLGSGIAEIRFPRSALGTFTSFRLALAAVATHSNSAAPAYTFDLAPAPPPPWIATFGAKASLPRSLTPAVDPATALSAATTAEGPVVTFKLTGASSTDVKLKGSLPPLSYDAPVELSTVLGATAGNINFGGQAGELFFKFTDAGTDEFAAGKDRVWTLSGAAESIPDLSFDTAYSATHAFTLTFEVTGGTPTEVRGSASELGSWGTGVALSGGPPYGSGPVSFASHDFTAAPLEFKAYYGASSSYEGSPSACSGSACNHLMDDDVINARVLSWTAGDYSNNPF